MVQCRNGNWWSVKCPSLYVGEWQNTGVIDGNVARIKFGISVAGICDWFGCYGSKYSLCTLWLYNSVHIVIGNISRRWILGSNITNSRKFQRIVSQTIKFHGASPLRIHKEKGNGSFFGMLRFPWPVWRI